MSSPDPSNIELSLLSEAGRLQRLMKDEGLSFEEAVARLLAPESAVDYAARNRAAMEALEARLLSPEYMDRYAAIMSEPDQAKREQLLADLKRENFALIDMAAVHRNISARNRQMQQEGLLPPDVKL